VKPQGYGKTMAKTLKMPNHHKKIYDQCLLIDLQSFEACQYELTLKCLPPFKDCKTLDVVTICCQHVFFQMLHKNCPMHSLQFLHVLHDATKNQQHLRELFDEPICPSS